MASAKEEAESALCRMPVLPVSGPDDGAARLRESSMIPPGFHLEHPTAREGCRSASQGLTLTLDAGRDATERSCRTSMPVSGASFEKAGPSHVPGRVVDAPFSVCFDPFMETAGQARTVLLDPFWVGRRADQFDQTCR